MTPTSSTAGQHGETAVSLGFESASAITTLMYPARVVGMLFLLVLCLLHARLYGGFSPFLVVFALFLLVYPHVWYLRARRRDTSGPAATLIDAFAAGITIYCISFSFLPSFILCTVVLANGLGLRGLRHGLLSLVVLAAGAALLVPIGGAAFVAPDSTLLNAVSAVYLVLYFSLYANMAYRRSLALKNSRIELKEQRIVAEIEKRRSEQLLLNILPPQIAADFLRGRRVAPRYHPDLSLLCIALATTLDDRTAGDQEELFDALNHRFKAYDAILARHGVVKMRTFGSTYLAAAGFADDDDDHPARVLRAALEIAAVSSSLPGSQAGDGGLALQLKIGLHCGPVAAGLVESERFAYDLVGATLDSVWEIVQRAPASVVCASEAMRARFADDATVWSELPQGAAEKERRLYAVRQRQHAVEAAAGDPAHDHVASAQSVR